MPEAAFDGGYQAYIIQISYYVKMERNKND